MALCRTQVPTSKRGMQLRVPGSMVYSVGKQYLTAVGAQNSVPPSPLTPAPPRPCVCVSARVGPGLPCWGVLLAAGSPSICLVQLLTGRKSTCFPMMLSPVGANRTVWGKGVTTRLVSYDCTAATDEAKRSCLIPLNPTVPRQVSSRRVVRLLGPCPTSLLSNKKAASSLWPPSP